MYLCLHNCNKDTIYPGRNFSYNIYTDMGKSSRQNSDKREVGTMYLDREEITCEEIHGMYIIIDP
jgi:hypothetical protein